MVGLMQVMIYLFCIYLVYKGVEIFQIAYCSNSGNHRKIGMILGLLMTVGAVVAGVAAVSMTELITYQMNNSLKDIPATFK